MSDEAKYQAGDIPDPADLPENTVVSPDTRRGDRLPPRQSRTRKWPVLQAGDVPRIALSDWSLEIAGHCRHPREINWNAFQELPRTSVFGDFHCVERWSRLGNLWEGVSTRTLVELAEPTADAHFVLVFGYDSSWMTNLALEDFVAADVLVADRHDGSPLSADHGGPARLIVPRRYAWKSAKWIRRIEFVSENRPGFWEQQGYHMQGDPWEEERFNPSGPLAGTD